MQEGKRLLWTLLPRTFPFSAVLALNSSQLFWQQQLFSHLQVLLTPARGGGCSSAGLPSPPSKGPPDPGCCAALRKQAREQNRWRKASTAATADEPPLTDLDWKLSRKQTQPASACSKAARGRAGGWGEGAATEEVSAGQYLSAPSASVCSW